jgi:hypothetical protein
LCIDYTTKESILLKCMDLRPIFVSLILWASNIFAQDSNSPYFFTFLTTSNNPSDFGATTQSPDVKPDNAKEKKNTKPQGVTLPDGTFIPNSPTKATTERKNELDIYKRFVDNPKLAAEMADEGVELAQAALASGKPNAAIPLDNVRAMYAIGIFYEYGYVVSENKENALEWRTKAIFAGTLKINGGKRDEYSKISEQEFIEANRILKAAIAEKQR